MIRFLLSEENGKKKYSAVTMEGSPLGYCRFYCDDFVLTIDQMECSEADVAEGLCRAAFDLGLRNLCAYGAFRNIDCPVLKNTCFGRVLHEDTFLTTQFFHTCANCGKN